jgi:hypothetical protein
MAADPRWLEILKASGGQALALGAACGGLLAAHYFKWIPPLEPWMIHAATFLGILGTILWVVSVGSAFYKFYPIDGWARYYIRQRRAKKDAEKYIPHMSAKEKEIVAYLLATNEKTFTADVDGGHAVTLISRGIVVRHMIPNQSARQDDIPFSIPDNVWAVLENNRDRFPIDRINPNDPYPWRVSIWES